PVPPVPQCASAPTSSSNSFRKTERARFFPLPSKWHLVLGGARAHYLEHHCLSLARTLWPAQRRHLAGLYPRHRGRTADCLAGAAWRAQARLLFPSRHNERLAVRTRLPWRHITGDRYPAQWLPACLQYSFAGLAADGAGDCQRLLWGLGLLALSGAHHTQSRRHDPFADVQRNRGY